MLEHSMGQLEELGKAGGTYVGGVVFFAGAIVILSLCISVAACKVFGRGELHKWWRSTRSDNMLEHSMGQLEELGKAGGTYVGGVVFFAGAVVILSLCISVAACKVFGRGELHKWWRSTRSDNMLEHSMGQLEELGKAGGTYVGGVVFFAGAVVILSLCISVAACKVFGRGELHKWWRSTRSDNMLEHSMGQLEELGKAGGTYVGGVVFFAGAVVILSLCISVAACKVFGRGEFHKWWRSTRSDNMLEHSMGQLEELGKAGGTYVGGVVFFAGAVVILSLCISVAACKVFGRGELHKWWRSTRSDNMLEHSMGQLEELGKAGGTYVGGVVFFAGAVVILSLCISVAACKVFGRGELHKWWRSTRSDNMLEHSMGQLEELGKAGGTYVGGVVFFAGAVVILSLCISVAACKVFGRGELHKWWRSTRSDNMLEHSMGQLEELGKAGGTYVGGVVFFAGAVVILSLCISVAACKVFGRGELHKWWRSTRSDNMLEHSMGQLEELGKAGGTYVGGVVFFAGAVVILSLCISVAACKVFGRGELHKWWRSTRSDNMLEHSMGQLEELGKAGGTYVGGVVFFAGAVVILSLCISVAACKVFGRDPDDTPDNCPDCEAARRASAKATPVKMWLPSSRSNRGPPDKAGRLGSVGSGVQPVYTALATCEDSWSDAGVTETTDEIFV